MLLYLCVCLACYNITAAWAVDREFVIYKALLDANEKGGDQQTDSQTKSQTKSQFSPLEVDFDMVFTSPNGCVGILIRVYCLPCLYSSSVCTVNGTSHAELTLGLPRHGSE